LKPIERIGTRSEASYDAFLLELSHPSKGKNDVNILFDIGGIDMEVIDIDILLRFPFGDDAKRSIPPDRLLFSLSMSKGGSDFRLIPALVTKATVTLLRVWTRASKEWIFEIFIWDEGFHPGPQAWREKSKSIHNFFIQLHKSLPISRPTVLGVLNYIFEPFEMQDSSLASFRKRFQLA